MSGKQAPAGQQSCAQKTCSPVHKCMPKWLTWGLGGFCTVAGIVAIVLGVVLVGSIDAAVENNVREAAVVSSSSDESYTNFATTDRGLSYGGTASDADDEGTASRRYVVNITNPMEVLLQGATPNIADVGYDVRSYSVKHGVELEGSRLSFHSQTIDIPENAAEAARMDSDVVYVPNLAYFGVLGLLDGVNFAARQDPVIAENPLTSFEDLAVGPMAAQALTLAKGQVESFVRISTFSLWWGIMYQAYVGLSAGSTATEAMAGPAGGGAPANLAFAASNDTVMIASIASVTAANISAQRPTPSEADVLFPLFADGTAGPLFASLIPSSPAEATEGHIRNNTRWTLAVNTLTATYAGASLTPPAERIQMHVLWLTFWAYQTVGHLVTPANKAAFEAAYIGILNDFVTYTPSGGSPCAGCCADLGGSGVNGTIANYDEVVAQQWGTAAVNSVPLTLIALASNPCSAAMAPTYKAVIEPLTLGKDVPRCSAGLSLFDIIGDPSVLPSPPEVNCFSSRSLNPLDAALGKTYAASALKPALMAQLLTNVTSGGGLLGAVAAGVLGAELPAGSNNVRQIHNVAKAMMAQYPTLAGNITAIHTATQALAALAAPTGSSTQAYIWQYGNATVAASTAIATAEAATAPMHAQCKAALSSRNLPPLDCFQLMDVNNWLDHIARVWVWYPQMVWNYPLPGHPGNSQGISTSNLAAGPIIRTTAREFLLNGTFDSYLFFLSNGNPAASKGPPTGVPEVSAEAFLSGKTDDEKNVINTGKDDISKIFNTEKHRGLARVPYFEASVAAPTATSEVKGSWDSSRWEPTFNVDAKIADAPALRQAYTTTIYRFINVALQGEVKGPNGKLDLWRYRLLNRDQLLAAGIPTADAYVVQPTAVDQAYGQPDCLVANKPLLPSADGSGPPSVDIFLSAPHFALCNTSDYRGPTGVSTLPYEGNFDTFLDIDPVSGFTLNARRRLGAYVQMRSSPWYPGLPTTQAGVHYYQPLFWTDEGASADQDQESALANGYQAAREARQGLPPSLFGGGAVLLLIGLLVLFAAATYPKKSAVAGGSGSGKDMVDDSNPLATSDP